MRTSPRRPLSAVSRANPASCLQARGMAKVHALATSIWRKLLQSSLASSQTSSPAGSEASLVEITEMEREAAKEAAERLANKRDRIAIDEELHRYAEAGILNNPSELEDFDLLRYWQVCFCLK